MPLFNRLFLLLLISAGQTAICDDVSIPECSGCVKEEKSAPTELPPLCESCVVVPTLSEESAVSRADFPE